MIYTTSELNFTTACNLPRATVVLIYDSREGPRLKYDRVIVDRHRISNDTMLHKMLNGAESREFLFFFLYFFFIIEAICNATSLVEDDVFISEE